MKRIALVFANSLILCLLLFSSNCSGDEINAANKTTAPLPFTIKTGYFVPSESDYSATAIVAGVFDFKCDAATNLRLEYLKAGEAECIESAPGSVTERCKLKTRIISASLIRFASEKKTGIYYGAGASMIKTNVKEQATFAGNRYYITSNQHKLGAVFILGYGNPNKGFSSEANYLLAGDKNWGMISDKRTKMDAFSIYIGYRMMLGN